MTRPRTPENQLRHNRSAILSLLSDGKERTTTQIANAASLKVNTATRHLCELRSEGVLESQPVNTKQLAWIFPPEQRYGYCMKALAKREGHRPTVFYTNKGGGRETPALKARRKVIKDYLRENGTATIAEIRDLIGGTTASSDLSRLVMRGDVRRIKPGLFEMAEQ